MADEAEDENLPKVKKEREKDAGLPELAPGDVVSPIECKMFDSANMQQTLAVPQRAVYSFQKELSGTLKKRLENIQIKLGSDDAHPIAEKRVDMKLFAGLQVWEEVDPVTGQLLELRTGIPPPPDSHRESVMKEPQPQPATAAKSAPVREKLKSIFD